MVVNRQKNGDLTDNDIEYSHVYIYIYIIIYVNRMIPVPDVSIGLLSEFGCVLFQRFKLALQNGAQYFPVALGS